MPPGLALVTCTDGSAVLLPEMPSLPWAQFAKRPTVPQPTKPSSSAAASSASSSSSSSANPAPQEDEEAALIGSYKDGLGQVPRMVLSGPSLPLAHALHGRAPAEGDFNPAVLWTRPATCSAISYAAASRETLNQSAMALAVGYGDCTMTVWFTDPTVLGDA
jgi:hypothetical protein